MLPIPAALYSRNPTICLRRVRAADSLLLHRRCWPERPVSEVERLIGRACRVAEQGTGLGIIAEAAEGPIAYGQFRLWPRGGEISDLVVCAAWRGQGVGTAIIQSLTRVAVNMDAACVDIGAAETNLRALALYRHLGFEDHHRMTLPVDGAALDVRYLRLQLAPAPIEERFLPA